MKNQKSTYSLSRSNDEERRYELSRWSPLTVSKIFEKVSLRRKSSNRENSKSIIETLKTGIRMTTLGYAACTMLVCWWQIWDSRDGEMSPSDASLFSKGGQISSSLWGLYLAAQENSPIFLVFAIEKAFYVVRWIQWMSRNDGMKEIKKAFRSKDVKILAPITYMAR